MDDEQHKRKAQRTTHLQTSQLVRSIAPSQKQQFMQCYNKDIEDIEYQHIARLLLHAPEGSRSQKVTQCHHIRGADD